MISKLFLFVSYKLAKMIVEPRFLLICLFIIIALQSDDSLLKMGQKQTCIKQVIAVFAEERNCASLDDGIKTHVYFQ